MNPNLRWNMADTPWDKLRPDLIADCAELRYMVCAASFVEITTELYTRNLVNHFAGDPGISTWLAEEWETQEMQHGQALRAYVQHVWPEFDWDKTYQAFFKEFSPLSAPEFLLPQRSLEMISRCVVEMGTSSYYTALHNATEEPVLKWLTRNIYEDEIAHYKHFLRYFRAYRKRDGVTRKQIAHTLWYRLRLIDSEDSYVSLKHVYAGFHPGAPWNHRVHKKIMKDCRRTAAPYIPHQMSVKMLLRPLEMGPKAQRLLVPPLTRMARLVA